MWKNRIKADFRLALILLFGVITVLGVTPFALYRFAIGQPLIGAIDLLIVLFIALGSVYAWRTNAIERATTLVAIAYSIGCVLVAHFIGLSGLLWVYPLLMGNFLLLRRRVAIALSTAVIVAVSLSEAALTGAAEIAMFMASSLVACLFAYIYASRSDSQHARLEAAAFLDPLTGACNRRGLEGELQIAMAESMRDGTPLGLLIFDLDHFKQVNDSFGHEAGDEVLVQVADLLRRSTRKGDRFYRLGGEEFGLLIRGADDASLRLIGEKLRAAVESEVRCHDRVVTISIGATCFAPGDSTRSWKSRADDAMYRAKHGGRNCVVVDAGGDRPPVDRESERATSA